MRIGIDARAVTQFPGIGRYGKNLVEALIKIDQENDYVIFKHPDWQFPAKAQANVKTVDVDIPLVSFGSLFKLAPIVNRCNLDLYHSLCEILPLTGKYKRVITVHDIINIAFPWAFKHQSLLKDYALRFYFRTVGRLGLSRAAQIIAVSQSTQVDLINWTDLDQDKISVIYEAVEDNFKKHPVEQLPEIKTRYQLPDRFLFYIGSFKRNKNIPGLFKGLSLYLADNPQDTDLKLILGGFKQFELSQIQQSLKELGLQDRIIFPGYIQEQDLPKVYNLATALIYPSTYEGFGLPVLEAMACQTPVICSNATSIPEVGGDAAWYFNPFDPVDIGRKIGEVVNDPNLRQKLSQKGAQQTKKFSWTKCAQETLEVYKKVYKHS